MMGSRERGARLAGMLGGVGFGMSRGWWFSFLGAWVVRRGGCRPVLGLPFRRGGGDRGVRGEVEGWVRA